MLDLGLLVTMVVLWAGLAAAARWLPITSYERADVLDQLYGPALAGLVVGRLTAVLLDDPESLGSIRALLVVRSGVEFWAGVAVFLALLRRSVVRRHRRRGHEALAELAPFALWGYALYEVTCGLRDGCYGPVSSLGLTPDGLAERHFPIGMAVGVAVAALALGVRHLRVVPAGDRLLLAVAGLAAIRAVAAVWLPHLGAGLTRQHEQSVAVAAAALGVLGVRGWRRARHRTRTTSESVPVLKAGGGGG